MVMTLTKGLDFRLPEYRREVFLRFFEFHLKYRAHAGAVYYVFPYLAEQGDWTMEEKLWFAYLNGNTQNPVTSYIIFNRYRTIPDDLNEMGEWFHSEKVYRNLGFDTDRRHHKKSLMSHVENYKGLLKGQTQEEYFGQYLKHGEYANFKKLWDVVSNRFLSFGRLSTFSYLEYLRIMGLNLDCDELFLDDMQGSKSHRNGLCKVMGRDDLDWHQDNPGFNGVYSTGLLSELEMEAAQLLDESKTRMRGAEYEKDISYFTLETALCTYKSWHRKNRRYPNVYNDLLHNRIKHAEERWIRPRFKVFWDARKAYLPDNLLLEKNPLDVGCVPEKQNHYRTTGQVIMMERDWGCFENDYSKRRITAASTLWTL